MNRLINAPLGLGFLFALAACGGGGGMGPDNNPGNGGGNNNTRVIVADPAFQSVIQEIFNRKGCSASSCHGSTQEAGLDLRSGNSYASLVSVMATQAAVARVIPGNATDSYLIVKVEGRQSFGERMPLNGSNLDNIDLTNLKNWINQGAKNN
jgi:putative intracellular protease/amidase